MYDTLTVTKQGVKDTDFLLKNEENWTFQTQGGEILSQKVIIPLNEITVENKTFHNGSIGISYSPKKSAVSVTTSLPKLIYGSSCCEVLAGDGSKLIESLFDKTKDFLDIDFGDMKVYRLDNSCNLETKKPTPNYISVLNHSLPAKVGTKDKGTYQGETVMLRDKSETIIFYDKIHQALDMNKGDKDLLAENYKDKNLLRYEIQNKTPQAMESKKRYGRRLRVSEIFSDEILERSAKLRLITFENILSNKPKYDFDFETYQGELRFMKEQNKKAMQDLGWFILFREGFMNVSDVAELMKGADYTRQAIHKAVRRLRSLQSCKTKSSKMLDEIYSQVLIKSKVA
jgi:hypothetical protein